MKRARNLHALVDIAKVTRYTLYIAFIKPWVLNSMFVFVRCGSLLPRLIVGVFVVYLTTVGHAAEVAVLPTSLGFPPGSAGTCTQTTFLQPLPSGSPQT